MSRSVKCGDKYSFIPGIPTGIDPGANIAPSNDAASSATVTTDATVLTVNSVPCQGNCGIVYRTEAATGTTGITACSAATPGNPDDDVWFKFTTTTTPSYKIAVNGSVGFNAVVQLFDNALTPIACLNAVGSGIGELMTTATLAAGTYYIRVYDAATSPNALTTGEFTICVSEFVPPPTNDECAAAIGLTVAGSCVVTNEPVNITGATASVSIPVCTAGSPGTPDDDVWYSFTTNATAGLVYNITLQSNSGYNGVLQLFSGTCGSLTAVNCVNTTSNAGVETISTSSLAANATYFIRVYNFGTGAGSGDYTICIYSPTPSCVTNLNPINNSIGVPYPSQTLSWTADANALGYDVYLSTVQADVLSSASIARVSLDQLATTYNATTLIASTDYYWKVVPKHPIANASGCATLKFTTAAACTGTPSPGNTLASVATACYGVNFILSLQNATPGGQVTYAWFKGPSATGPWTSFGTSAATQTTNAVATTFYYCEVTCGATSNMGPSAPVQVLIGGTLPEGFYSSTFPPTCWIAGTGWTRLGTASVNGTPGGSAKYDFYNLVTNADLETPSFAASTAGQALNFDEAYATYTGEIDQLVIKTSLDLELIIQPLLLLMEEQQEH